ncbi:MAG: SGNH/GDSL hydrolase family protein [Sulfuricaulis sp.]
MKITVQYSRRRFIKSATTLAGGLATGALFSGCSGSSNSGQSAVTPVTPVTPLGFNNVFPLASTDTDLFLDVDFRQGESVTDTILVTANGFRKMGSVGLWDTTLGFNPNGTQYYTISDWVPQAMVSRASIGNQFTVYAEVQRDAIAATWLDDNANFIDSGAGPSLDNPYTPTSFGHVISLRGNQTPWPYLKMLYQVTSGPVGRFVYDQFDNADEGGVTIRFHPDPLATEDAFAKLHIVVDINDVRYYIDGALVKTYTRTTNVLTDDLFNVVSIGADNSGGNSILKGYIRRIQLLKRTVDNLGAIDTKIAFIGDSFVQRGAGHATPSSITVAGVDAVQNGLNDIGLTDNSDPTKIPVIGTYYVPWIWALRKMAANYSLRFRYYAAGDAGHGWSPTVANETAQIRPAFRDAVIAYNPEILVALGSVNDVNVALPPTDLLGETKAVLDEFIDGCPNLRKILFCQTFPGYKGSAPANNSAAIAQYEAQVALQAQLDGYRGKVEIIYTYSALGGENYVSVK